MHREDDESVPFLPEERNPVFYIYPICIAVSITFAILWLFTNILMERPAIVFTGCFVAAVLLLSAGIMEMKHADTYLDLTIIKDEDLLTHPVFLHNFIMCLISIFGMTIYLLQGWILVDYWLQIEKQKRISDDDYEDTNFDESDEDDDHQVPKRINKRENKETEEAGELDPIPTLEKFPSLASLSQADSVSEAPVILYCCFLDCFNYIKHHYFTKRPVHEFQVIHVV